VARSSLPQNYLDTLATTAVTRAPSCKVEIEYGASPTWHDVSADVISVSISQSMDMRADEAQISLANPARLYSLLWCDQADPPTDIGHRVRIWLTNAPAALIQVFTGYIVQASNTVKRGDAEVVTLRCMDAGWRAWQSEITMEPVLGRPEPSMLGSIIRGRSSTANRQINKLVADILKHPTVGLVDADIGLASLDYFVTDWKPGTFNPMSDIAQLLDVKHHYLRFNWEGKAVSGPIVPTAASSWTYGALGANPLLVSFEERWQAPERMASVVNAVGQEIATLDIMVESEIYHETLHWNTGYEQHWTGGTPGFGYLKREYFAFTVSPPPTDYSSLRLERVADSSVPGGAPDVAAADYMGMRTPPHEDQAIILVNWYPHADPDGWVEVKFYGSAMTTLGGGQFTGTATNTTLAAAGYAGVSEYSNDYLKDNAACEWLAKRLATWLANECQPATLVVPCNLVHEPGDLITVNLDKYGGAAARAVDYIILSHKIEYERGKPNLSTLELVRDTTHMW